MTECESGENDSFHAAFTVINFTKNTNALRAVPDSFQGKNLSLYTNQINQ